MALQCNGKGCGGAWDCDSCTQSACDKYVTCDMCGAELRDKYYDFEGTHYCEDCMKNEFEKQAY